MARKVQIFYKGSDGRHHYLSSTSSYKTVAEAVKSYKDILKRSSKFPQTRRAILKELMGYEKGKKPVMTRIYGRFSK